MININIDREEDWFFEIKISVENGTVESLTKVRKETSEKLVLKKIAIPPVQYIIENKERIKQISKQIERDQDINEDFSYSTKPKIIQYTSSSS